MREKEREIQTITTLSIVLAFFAPFFYQLLARK